MTLDEIRASDKAVLTCEDVAKALHVAPQKLRVQARQRPQTLPFPVMVIGARVHIPREPFLAVFGGGKG